MVDQNARMMAKPFSAFERIIKFEWLLWILTVTVFFLAINHSLVFGTGVGIWDINGAYMPYQSIVADHARAGKFAVWDVWSNGGVLIAGDPQFGAFSPINFFLGFLLGGKTIGFRFYWLFVWWLGALGIMMLGRHLRAPAWGAAAVALGYLFSGIYITNAEHTAILIGYSFIPFVVWRLDAALCSKQLFPAIQAGAIWGLSALSGYPALTILTVFYCGLWAIGRLLFNESNSVKNENPPAPIEEQRPTFRFIFVALILMGFVGTLILSPTYFSFFYEGAGTTTRVNSLSRETIIKENSLHPGAIATFASPYLALQKVYNASYLWLGMDVSMSSIYVGVVITVFALFALINNRKDWFRWWVLFLALFSLTCAMSEVFPLRGWLYDFIYPTRFFRHSSLFRSYYLFSISVLALIGMRDIANAIRNNSNRAWRNLQITSCLLAFGAILVFITLVNSLVTLGGKINLAYGHVFISWLAICVIAYASNKFFNRQQHLIIPALFVALALFDAFCTHRLSQGLIISEDKSVVERWTALDLQHSANLDLTTKGLYREESSCYPDASCPSLSNDQMITKTPVFNTYSTQVNLFQVEMAKNSVLRGMAVGNNRIWFSSQVAQVSASQDVFAGFVKRADALGRAPLIIHSRENMLGSKPNSAVSMNEEVVNQAEIIEKLPPAESISVIVTKYTSDKFVFDVDCPTDGWLLVTDRWARAWRAEVNNVSTPVYGGNFIFRAVKVSAGRNTIAFAYQPYSFPWMLIMSWGTLTAVAVFSFVLKTKKQLVNLLASYLQFR
jgi:hypothetical protein